LGSRTARGVPRNQRELPQKYTPYVRRSGFWRYTLWKLKAVEGKEAKETEDAPAYLAFVVRPGGSLQVVDLGPAERLETAVDAWRAAVGTPLLRGRGPGPPVQKPSESDPASGQRRLGDELRRLVLDPVLAAAGAVEHLAVAADGAVHLLPLDALPLGAGAVGDKLSVRLVASLRGLSFGAGSQLAAPRLLALGGIDYGAKLVDSTTAVAAWVERGAPVEVRRSASWKEGFKPLTATSNEARLVVGSFAKSFPDSPEPWLLGGAEASKAALLALAPRARFLHLATHGWFAPESVPSQADERKLDARLGLGGFEGARETVRGFSPFVLCGLALAGANLAPQDGGHVDGVVTAEELSGLELSGLELAVLSACETNVGLQRASKGIASLQEALHRAGVRTAVTSLWKVPDETTRELMGEFYRRVWVLKEPKSKALWEAKKRLRAKRDPLSGKPIYSLKDWAGWVLSGEG
jgi:CHAT domain-containing protein